MTTFVCALFGKTSTVKRIESDNESDDMTGIAAEYVHKHVRYSIGDVCFVAVVPDNSECGKLQFKTTLWRVKCIDGECAYFSDIVTEEQAKAEIAKHEQT